MSMQRGKKRKLWCRREVKTSSRREGEEMTNDREGKKEKGQEEEKEGKQRIRGGGEREVDIQRERERDAPLQATGWR